MKKTMLALFLIILSSVAFSQSSRVINAFYDGKTQEFIVNTVKANGTTGYIRTNKIVLITERVAICNSGCLAEIKGISYSSFALIVAGHKVATVTTHDSDNLITADAFEVLTFSEKDRLVVNLNKLEIDQRAEVE